MNGSNTAPSYAFTSDPDMGFYYLASGRMGWTANGGVDRIVFDACGAEIMIMCTCNADINRGITINQTDADNQILALKSCDVGHSVTSLAETDTYMFFKKRSTKAGGEITAIGDCGVEAFTVVSIAASDCTNHTAGANASIQFRSGLVADSGTGTKAHNTNGNLFAVRANTGGYTKFIVDQEGDIFYDGSAAAYDSYCDAALTRTLAHTMQAASCEPSTIIRNKWDDFTSYNEQSLIDLNILGGPVVDVDPSERGLVNLTQLQRLHNGAIWQLHSKLNAQSEELAALKGQLNALTEGK